MAPSWPSLYRYNACQQIFRNVFTSTNQKHPIHENVPVTSRGSRRETEKKRCPNIFKGRSAIIQNAFPAWRKTQRTLMSNGCFCKQRDRAGRSGHTDRWTATVCVTATWKNRSLFPHSHCVECMREDFCRVCWSVSHRQCRGRKWGEAFLGWRRVLWRQCSRKIHYDLPSKKS